MSGSVLNTFAPPIPPSAPLPSNEQPRMLTANLGDGYTVTAPDGINTTPVNATLSWNMLTAAQYNSILGFLRGQEGVTFLYTLPSETTPRKWQAMSWRPNQQATWYELQVLIQERFDLNAY